MRKIFLYAIILFMAHLYSCSKSPSGNPQITRQELKSTVEYLASPKLQGRLAGSEGYNQAAQYLAETFKRCRLQNAGFEDYFQRFSLEYNRIRESQFAIITPDAIREYRLGTDYVCRGFSGSGDVRASVVFCGYGISRPGMGYDDFEGVDAEGKIVVEFKRDPQWRLNGERIGYRSLRKKVKAARQHGAQAIIFVSLPNARNPQKPIGSVMHGEGRQNEDFPQIHISLEAARHLFRNSGHTLSELQSEIDRNQAPRSIDLSSQAHIRVQAAYDRQKPSMNVVGMVEGDSLKREYVVVGAHLDHVGGQAGKVYFPGANDNASGVAALMEMAEALALREEKPGRSVIFVGFSAEEQGLNGSRYFIDHPPVNKDQIQAMINLDCVGHGDSIVVGGGKSFPRLYQMVKQKDDAMKQMMTNRTWGGGGADATPFYEQGIPTLYFATKNSYTHLHLPGDKPETLNYSLHQYLTTLAYETTLEMAMGKNMDGK